MDKIGKPFEIINPTGVPNATHFNLKKSGPKVSMIERFTACIPILNAQNTAQDMHHLALYFNTHGTHSNMQYSRSVSIMYCRKLSTSKAVMKACCKLYHQNHYR